MRLSLETREVGRVTIVRCNGRIVAGSESESLRSHVTWLLRDRRAIVLHLGEVGFIDSSGLGTIVRSLTSTRQVHGDLKLCNVPEHVRKVLELSQLTKLFDAHESEENAVAAFYRPGAKAEAPIPTGRSVLCLDCNADVLACVRELMRRAGYHVHTSSRLGDALILMRVSQFDLVLIGPELTSSAATHQGFQAACAKVLVIELGSDFSGCDAGAACAGLLEKIEAHFNPKMA
jgi:anti-sigma B factor antagonist